MATLEELYERHLALGHAIQTGVEYARQHDPTEVNPKHMRTGLNMAMCGQAALVRLLARKGLITEVEYMEALITELEAEVKRYEERLSQHYGGNTKITLG